MSGGVGVCKGSVERRTGSVVTDVPITRAVDTDRVHASCRTRCPWHRSRELIGIRGGSAYIAHGGMIIRACSIIVAGLSMKEPQSFHP
jgi:hypothetical protein